MRQTAQFFKPIYYLIEFKILKVLTFTLMSLIKGNFVIYFS